MREANDALYQRGRYRLGWDRRADGSLRTPFLTIFWYDDAARRVRSRSTGTESIPAAQDALDALYLERERGLTVCPTCHRPFEGEQTVGYLLADSLADYLVAKQGAPDLSSIRPKVAHMLDFIEATGRAAITCDQTDRAVIDAFRAWSAEQPVMVGKRQPVARRRAPATTESCVRYTAAAINRSHERRDARHPASFAALPTGDVNATPQFRASVADLAAMFRYCIHPQPPAGEAWTAKERDRRRRQRQNLLRFLQLSVATWGRPEAVCDFSVDPARGQWISAARVVRLNPIGRRQTKKRRATVPVGRRVAALLDRAEGHFITVKSVAQAFDTMLDEIDLPRGRQATYLVRRSVSQIARARIGEANWQQGKMMLGHAECITDLYALPDPANLGIALAATESIIDEITALVPGAFSGAYTGLAPELRAVGDS